MLTFHLHCLPAIEIRVKLLICQTLSRNNVRHAYIQDYLLKEARKMLRFFVENCLLCQMYHPKGCRQSFQRYIHDT